jgi:prepilin-type N-terminal cleavage/methylation domain-containing protein
MRRKLEKQNNRRGDTLIEVMLSISIFAMVALITINMMNDGINTAQRTLEAEMARNEIDAQSEALRFIHNNYVAERNMDKSQFREAWGRITEKAKGSDTIKDTTNNNNNKKVYFDINNMESCEEPYEDGGHLSAYGAFIINPRLLIPNNYGSANNDSIVTPSERVEYMKIKYSDLLGKMLIHYVDDKTGERRSDKFSAPSLYPRIIYKRLDGNNGETTGEQSLSDMGVIYNEIDKAEGIWINAVGNQEGTKAARSDYYDFYIRTCWHSAGTRVPSTITTVVRLYNPEVME